MAAAAAMQRKAVGLAAILVAILTVRLCGLRRPTGDKGRQRIDITRVGLRLRLRLWRTRLGACLLRLRVALVARLIGLRGVARNERLCVGRDIGLRLARAERRLVAELLALTLTVVLAVLEIVLIALRELLVVAFNALRLEVRILLTELLLRGCDQAEIMLGVLEVIFGRYRIAGRMGVAGKLEIFLRHVIGRSADLHIRAVRLINPGERIVATAVVIVVVIIVIVVAAPAHALVVVL